MIPRFSRRLASPSFAKANNKLCPARPEQGFSLIETLIAIGIFVMVITVFAVMITVAAQLVGDTKRDLQHTYTTKSVLEMVRSDPDRFRTVSVINKVNVNGDDILRYVYGRERDWEADLTWGIDTVSVFVYGEPTGSPPTEKLDY
ncbi:MAG: type IV pilus modification PilV family protein [Candidatus Saccharibacteria bacterium]